MNYFDFNTGTLTAYLERRHVRQYLCINRAYRVPATGKLDSFEETFLHEAAPSQRNSVETMRLTATLANGKCGILQQYFIELTTPRQQEPVAVQTIVSQSPSNVTTTTTVVLVDESLQSQYDRFFEQVVLLEQIREHVEMKVQTPDRKLSAVLERIQMLRSSIKEIEIQLDLSMEHQFDD